VCLMLLYTVFHKTNSTPYICLLTTSRFKLLKLGSFTGQVIDAVSPTRLRDIFGDLM